MAHDIPTLNQALQGRYRIQEELGEGGMATVYLAEDLKHRRKVAVKVLKAELAAVVGAERFLTEIETTANLTHPHILPLHDSGEADGVLFYVMPYVEGESLREKLDRERQLPVPEAVEIATDLAEALDYAHRHGVIHRDIKPANILIHEGRPLIADFGIALAVGAAGGPRLTETGLSVGTPYYMSPEQATGDQVVGPQTDVYALGCVLYEMLVGEPPYTGATAQAVLGKIIQGGQVSATTQRRSIPPNVDGAIRKALEKLPADRFTSAQEFGNALEDPAFRHGQDGAEGPLPLAGSWRRVALGAMALAAALALSLAWALLRAPHPEPVSRYGIELPAGQGLTDVLLPTFTLVPDGSAIVYTGPGEQGSQLWVKRRDRYEPTPLSGTAGGIVPSVSPDGEWVAFAVGGQLMKAPMVGGAPVVLTDSLFAGGQTALPWDGNDALLFVAQDFSLRRISAAGGASELLFEPEESQAPIFPSPLPGGKGILFTLCTANCNEVLGVHVLDLETGEATVIAGGSVRGLYTPTGHLVTIRDDGSVFAVPFDEGSLEADGSPVPVLDGVKVDAGVVPDLALARDGTLLMLTGAPQSTNLEFAWMDRQGNATTVDPEWSFDAGDANRGWDLHPDGDRIALRALARNNHDIWIKEVPGGPASRLTFHEAHDRMPRWTPDGDSLTFLSDRNGNLDVWIRAADGTGTPRLLFDHDAFLAQGFYTPDGEYLVLRTGGTAGVEGGRNILVVRPGTDSVATPLLAEESYDESAPAISPDSRWIAYQSTETGQEEIFVRPFPNVEDGKWQVSTTGGIMPLWAHGGGELFFRNGNGELVAAQLETGGRFRVGERHVLFELPSNYQQGTVVGMYDVTADDQRFLMARAAGSEEVPSQLILVEGWLRELEERAGR